MTEHTPTPWELHEATEHHGAYIVSAWGRTICDLYAMSNPMAASVRNGGTSFPVPFDDMEANAALIVEAVNNHDALVKARSTFLGYLQAENACKRTGSACRETCACELELQGLVKAFGPRGAVGGSGKP